jgi:hypothetical protein
MKTILTLLAFSFSTTVFATQVLLTCNTKEALKDLEQVTVSEQDNFLTLTQTLSNGEVYASKLSWDEFESKDIQLYGLRTFRHLINNFDTDHEWFVHEYAPGFDAFGRVDCISN